MKMLLAVAACFVAASALAQSPRHDRRLFHISGHSAYSCRDPRALLAITEPNARQRWGDLNYMLIAQEGDCGEVDNSLPFLICHSGPRVSFMAQIRNGAPGRCYAMLTNKLADEQGDPVPVGVSN